jgi:ABC-2 type transport system permease protein
MINFNLFYNELIKVLFKRRTYISFILITFLIPLIVYGFEYGAVSLEDKISDQMQDIVVTAGSAVNGYLAAYIIISILISQMSFLSTIVPSEIISGEYSKGTFRIYLTRPISRSSLFLSKVLVVLLYTTLMMVYFFTYTILVSYLILDKGMLIVFHDGIVGLDPVNDNVLYRFFLGFMLSNFIMITVSFLCLMFSSFSKNSVTPIISTISIVFIGAAILFIPIDIFEAINPYIFTGYMNIFLKAFYEPIPYELFYDCLYVCSAWSLLFLSIAYYNFIRRDILE